MVSSRFIDELQPGAELHGDCFLTWHLSRAVAGRHLGRRDQHCANICLAWPACRALPAETVSAIHCSLDIKQLQRQRGPCRSGVCRSSAAHAMHLPARSAANTDNSKPCRMESRRSVPLVNPRQCGQAPLQGAERAVHHAARPATIRIGVQQAGSPGRQNGPQIDQKLALG